MLQPLACTREWNIANSAIFTAYFSLPWSILFLELRQKRIFIEIMDGVHQAYSVMGSQYLDCRHGKLRRPGNASETVKLTVSTVAELIRLWQTFTNVMSIAWVLSGLRVYKTVCLMITKDCSSRTLTMSIFSKTATFLDWNDSSILEIWRLRGWGQVTNPMTYLIAGPPCRKGQLLHHC